VVTYDHLDESVAAVIKRAKELASMVKVVS
jgi:hypothetical protein